MEKSKATMNEAMDVYLFSDLPDSVKVEKSLALTNKALELDDHNLAAFNHKVTLLFYKKDVEGLLKISDHLIQLMPKKPFYFGQKALYLELKGDTVHANEFYHRSISMYQDYIKTDSLDFNLMMEYVGILQTAGDTILANEILGEMDNMNFDEAQKKMIVFAKRQPFPKQKLKKYLAGEIEYSQIEADKNYPQQ
jgi:hypothetical protein